MRRRPHLAPLALVALVVLAGLVAGCRSQALMAPDGATIYWATNSPTPNRMATATLASSAMPTLGGALRGGMLSPDGSIGYAVFEDGTMTRVSLPSGDEIGPSIATGLGALGPSVPLVAMSPDGGTAIVGRAGLDTLHRIDLATMTVTGSAQVAPGESLSSRAVFTPDGEHLIVILDTALPNTALKVRVSDLAVVGGPLVLSDEPVNGAAAGIVLSLDGTTGYAVYPRRTSRFDVATMTLTGAFTYETNFGPQAGTLIRSPAGTRAYLVTANQPNELVTLDLEGMRWLDFHRLTGLPVANQESWTAISPDGTEVFVGDEFGAVERVRVGTTNPLDVTVGGSGSVRTSRGAVCAEACAYDLLDFETVTLTATADSDAAFTGWSGACTGAAETCSIPMDEARSVTATFATTIRPRLGLVRTRARTGATRVVFRTRLAPSEPGRITQRIVRRTSGRARTTRVVCRSTRTVRRAGATTITCLSSTALRRLLASRSLRVRVTTTLRTADGRTRSTSRTLRLSRAPLRPTPPVTG